MSFRPLLSVRWVWLTIALLASAAGAADIPEPGVQAIFKQLYEQAAKERSCAALEPVLDDQFTAVLVTLGSGQGQVSISGVAELRQHYAALKDLIGDGTYTLTVRPEGSADYAGDMATAHGTLERGIVSGQGVEYHLTNFWTAVFRKRGAQWRLLRLHESMDPVINPRIISMKHDLIVRASFIALVVGMALGWLFRALLFKKQTPN